MERTNRENRRLNRASSRPSGARAGIPRNTLWPFLKGQSRRVAGDPGIAFGKPGWRAEHRRCLWRL